MLKTSKLCLNFFWIPLNCFELCSVSPEKMNRFLVPHSQELFRLAGICSVRISRSGTSSSRSRSAVNCYPSYTEISAAAWARVASSLRALNSSLAIHAFYCCSGCFVATGSLWSALIWSRHICQVSSAKVFSCRMICACFLLDNGSIQKTSSRVSSMPIPKTWRFFVLSPIVLPKKKYTNLGKFRIYMPKSNLFSTIQVYLEFF